MDILTSAPLGLPLGKQEVSRVLYDHGNQNRVLSVNDKHDPTCSMFLYVANQSDLNAMHVLVNYIKLTYRGWPIH